MTRNRQRWTLILLGCAVLAFAVLAGNLSRLELLPGQPLPIPDLMRTFLPHESQAVQVPQFAIVARIFFFFVVWIACPVVVVALIISADLRRRLLKTLPIFITAAFVIYWLARLIRNLLSLNDASAVGGRAGGPSTQPPGLNLPTPPAFIADPPRWLVIGVSIAIAAGVVLVFWRLRPRARPQDDLELLVQEAQSALNELEAGGDVRDTIMRCYADMSRVVRETHGVTRQEGTTPREFEQVLARVGLRDEHIQQLTRLFERVRYSPDKPGAREEREAVACLSAIVVAYGKAS